MCLQCETDAIGYGYAFPGFALMRAKKTDYPDHPDMQIWKEGQWALVEMNDPTVYLTFAPMKEGDESVYDPDDAFLKVGKQTDDDVMAACDARAVYRLVEAAKTKGYDPKEDGGFGFWLTDYLAKYLETAQIVE